MNKAMIMELLPHRDNMLLIDEATLLEDGSAIGKYTVRGDEWFLQGHFPQNPVVPGVVLCEIMGQSCCVLLCGQSKGKLPMFTAMNDVRFKKPVKPGDEITVKAALTRQKGPFYFASCQAFVYGALCAKAELSFALVDKE